MDRFILDDYVICERPQLDVKTQASDLNLRKAITPLLEKCPYLLQHVQEAHELYKATNLTSLNADEFASIHLFIMEYGGKSLRKEMKNDLCSRDAQNSMKWLAYETILKAAIAKLPDGHGSYWCCVSEQVYKSIHNVKKIRVKTFFFASTSMDLIKKNTPSTMNLCQINVQRAKKLPIPFRITESEEIILLPNTVLQYQSDDHVNSRLILHFTEVCGDDQKQNETHGANKSSQSTSNDGLKKLFDICSYIFIKILNEVTMFHDLGRFQHREVSIARVHVNPVGTLQI